MAAGESTGDQLGNGGSGCRGADRRWETEHIVQDVSPKRNNWRRYGSGELSTQSGNVYFHATFRASRTIYLLLCMLQTASTSPRSN